MGYFLNDDGDDKVPLMQKFLQILINILVLEPLKNEFFLERLGATQRCFCYKCGSLYHIDNVCEQLDIDREGVLDPRNAYEPRMRFAQQGIVVIPKPQSRNMGRRK